MRQSISAGSKFNPKWNYSAETRFRAISFFRVASAPVNGWPTLAREPAASGAWNADNSLVCSELRVICVQSRGKIKKI